MSKCYNCGEKISYWTKIKSLPLGWGDITCKKCKKENSHSMFNRLLGLIAIAMFALGAYFLIPLNPVTGIITSGVIAIGFMFLLTIFFTFTKKD